MFKGETLLFHNSHRGQYCKHTLPCSHNVCMCLDTVLIHATSIITVCHYPIMFRTLLTCYKRSGSINLM